ncbi:LysM peptidoglycan-binding domain-containing protein [Patescibacteria group bacterium]|nr:LysM peptidoglycan-binding domain-containing protein [Patescibacteria group bacterium]
MQPLKKLKVASPILTTIFLFTTIFSGTSFVYADETETTYYFLTDHLGSVDVILDEDGSVVERADYLPFGSDRLRTTETEAPDTDYKFTGKELDGETGLMYYGARYYDPLIGRFTTADPWEGDLLNPQTLNKYSYAVNNPLFFLDPTGMYIVKTGEVEKGDTLTAITSDINTHYGTNYSYNDVANINNIKNPDKIQAGQIIRVGTLDGWQPPTSSDGIGESYWNGLNESQQKIFNIHKNFYQSGLPETLDARNTAEWTDPRDAIAHNIGTSNNVEIRGIGSRAGQQAIYDQQGNLVTSPENMGTFDLVPPEFGNYHAHLRVDVKPWIEWGNSPADTSTTEERIQGMAKDIKGRYALDYLNYDY